MGWKLAHGIDGQGSRYYNSKAKIDNFENNLRYLWFVGFNVFLGHQEKSIKGRYKFCE